MRRYALLIIMLVLVVLTACKPDPAMTPTPTATPRPEVVVATEDPNAGVEVTEEATPEVTPEITADYGPDSYPDDVNPLTGLVVDDPAVLDRPPLLIKISNSPSIVRPQAGLNSADHVWEHTLEGLRIATRYTAVFLANAPERVGSVRSGRLPDLELMPMYDGIYMSSGFSSNRNNPSGPPRMNEIMREQDWLDQNFSAEYGYREPYAIRYEEEDTEGTEHTLFAVPEKLWELAEERGIGASDNLAPGLAFNTLAPDGGTTTTEVEVNYPGGGANNLWRYDEDSEKWLRWTDGELHVDALTDEQLAFDNVVVIYLDHYIAEFVETEPNWYGVGVDLTGSGDAVVLRDGQRYEVTWERPADGKIIQFVDASGEPFEFKPGNIWFHMATTGTEPLTVEFAGE